MKFVHCNLSIHFQYGTFKLVARIPFLYLIQNYLSNSADEFVPQKNAQRTISPFVESFVFQVVNSLRSAFYIIYLLAPH